MNTTETYLTEIYTAHAAKLVKRFGLDRVWEAMAGAITSRPYGEERYQHAVKIRMVLGQD